MKEIRKDSREASDASDWNVSRRDFVKAAAALTGSMAIGLPPILNAYDRLASRNMEVLAVHLTLTVNGKQHLLAIDPRMSLLDLLREELRMTGTKKGCDRGQCGACTALVNGRRINSCLSLAAAHDGDEIITIEGLAQNDQLHPMQQAFLEQDGYQCGYCTPGQICSAVAMLDEWKRGEASMCSIGSPRHERTRGDLSREEIRERMSGNLCRCSAYANIVASIEAAHRMGKS
jgi:xanthine dehydrogenase YagT iron-sulfur-binding subunit